MLCAKCNYDNPADALFCIRGGTKVENRCSSCNTVNPTDANFCRKCGGALEAGVPISSRSPHAALGIPRVEVTHEWPTAEGLEGERKTVTALFADIKGSTELMEDLDPEEARAIVDPALKLMIDAAHRYDGYIVQSTGDGIFALFGAPVCARGPSAESMAVVGAALDCQNIKDSLLEGVEFELSGDFINGK